LIGIAERHRGQRSRSGAQEHAAAFSVDLEEYYHPELIRRHARGKPLGSRVESSTRPILDLLDRRGVQATFFIVGEVIRSAPALIRRIVDAGHEIGCHTDTHRPLWEMTAESFRDEIQRFKSALRDAVGDVPVRGFRAPTFSIDRRTEWAFRVLAEEGFTYDSSVVPIQGPLYGCPGAPFGIYRPSRENFLLDDERGPLVEFPAPVATVAGGHVPVGGGFYLRAMPLWVYWRLVRGVLRRRPFFLYIHPWETDPGIPRFQIPGLARWATYTGIDRMLAKIEQLLERVRFTTMRSAIEASGFGV
jgi:polysaccharide deacetylase family protein (PEP-CTERM system associated)